MNRPIIKGTANHKASIAKAKAQSVVSQSRTKGDAGLIAAADALGRSYKPQAIDFSLDKINIDVPEKKKKEKQPKVKKSKSDYGSYEEYLAEEKELQKNIDDKDYQAYLDQESGSGTSDQNLPSREQWERNLKKPSYKPLSKKDWTDLNVEAGMKRPKVKKEKKVKVKKEKGENIFEKGYQSIKDKIRIARENIEKKKKQDELDFQTERLRKAEEGPGSDYDFSELDNEPGLDAIKTEKYKSPEAGAKEGKELLSRTKASRNKALQDAAKKYNVKVEDLEAKEIGGKREFFPKQDVVGGKEETQWDDKLGRFRKPEATIPVGKEEQAKAVEEMKPKFPKGMDPNLATTGEIALNYDTNTYEYTQQYYDRLAKEKIEQQKVEPTSTTTKPVVEEKKPRVSNARQRRLDKKYENAGPSVRANMIADGYVPDEGKTVMKMRDNRIYRNAVKGEIVQQNMIKSGYIPE